VGDALEGVEEEADDVGNGEHPDPPRLAFVPDEQFVDSFGDEDVDGLDEGDGFIDGGAQQQDFRDEALEGELREETATTLWMELLLCRY
jgi:hypothetical protein